MNLRDLSIKRKLTLMAMLTSSIALVLSSASFLVYDLVSFRKLLNQDLTTQAQIIAYNSAAAMAFKDEAAAKVTLSALTAKDDVLAAVLYTTDGHIFAHYSRADNLNAPVPERPGGDGYRLEGNYIEVFSEVKLGGERLGTLFLQSDMQRWNARARQYAGILGIFVLISGAFSWLVSSKLQILVSGPILHLEQTMRAVSVDRNYAVRAVKSCGDEIGRLIDGFNTMLSEIQHRDKAVQRANDDLKTRTKELEQEIFHRKRTQEELLKAKDSAEDASRAKSAFLANMSHELRTPLNAIIGYSEMLEEESRESGQAESVRDLQRIQSAGKHLLSLINDVLDLSKIEAGKMALHLETFQLDPLIEEIGTTLQPAAEKNSNRLTLNVPEELGAMHADVTKVRQVLFNLVSNACKFTDHGTITLDVERRSDENEQDWIIFRVTDSGIGMTPEQQWKLFQDFAQADTSIVRKFGGTGLGLAISSRFAEMMHGRIDVESKIGEGSTFTVTLPASVAAGGTEAAPPPVQKVRPEEPRETTVAVEKKEQSDTILIIDDDATVRDLMTRTLGKLGFNTVAAESGEAGLRLAREIRPRIITLDVVMPGLDGWDVLAEFKEDPELASIPVIMVTVVDNEALGLDRGASDYLVKPIDRDRLAVALEQYRTRPVELEASSS
ncbi:MAG TPA: ATP-binding protein [Terriglobia bacterium]|jgi:signal transduction histidine kinase/CheY-like chemotaxis protein